MSKTREEITRIEALKHLGLTCTGPDRDGFYEATLGIGTHGVRGLSRNPSAAIAYALEEAAVLFRADAKRQKDAGDPPA